MRTSFGDAVGLPESGVPDRLGTHERIRVDGNGDGGSAGMEMNRKDHSQGQGQVQYPFGYGDAVEVLRLVHESEGFASLELNIGDIRISIQRAATTDAAVSQPVMRKPSRQGAGLSSAGVGGVAPAKNAVPAAVTSATATATASTPAVNQESLEKIITPTLGVFYRRSSPEAEPFVEEGDVIAEGDQIGVLEVMKLYMPINSTVSGRIAKIVAQDATLVEHGDVLMLVDPL